MNELNVLICEDEGPAGKLLVSYLEEIAPGISIVGIIETGEEAKDMILKQGDSIDLIFMDIELADGPCFNTLDQMELSTPIIFTTAYDEYALKAFRLNSVDYLVKPITKEHVLSALEKFESMKTMFVDTEKFRFTRNFFEQKTYKERFLVKLGRKLFPVKTKEIAYFMATDKMVWLVTDQNKKYIINYTLNDLEELLDPDLFFRLNRQFICNISSIQELEPYFKGQVTAKLFPIPDIEVVVSRNKTPELKNWLGV